jgi:transcriptional regulator with XRE-family HTH domain
MSTSMAARWDAPEYQRISSVHYEAGGLAVRFEDGSEVTVEADRVLPPHAREVDWERLAFDPYEITIPTADEEVEIPWSTIRVVTDKDYSAHLAAAAEEQARRIGQRIRELRRIRKLSSKELAERAGITPQSLSRIEHGRHDVVLTTLQRILAAMGYSLRDLASAPADADAEPALLRRLTATGLDQEFVLNRLLPRGLRAARDGRSLTDSIVHVASRVFGWSPAEILSTTPLRFDPAIAQAARFKTPGRVNQLRKAAYTSYAYYLSKIVLRAAPDLMPRALPETPEALRQVVVERYGSLTFEYLLRFAWDSGIPVLSLRDSGAFHGACWRIEGRSVIVLKHVTNAHALWLFDLGHELDHVGHHLSEAQPFVIEGEEIAPSKSADSDEEWEASNFAGTLVLYGRAEELVEKCVEVARGSVERLKTAVQRVAAEERVPLDSLANYLAFRLSLQGINWWGTANRFQITDPPPWNIGRDNLLERVQLQLLEPLDRELLLQALADPGEG